MWGGTRIAESYHRANTPTICAESWEVSDRPEGMSVVANGPLANTTLRELMETMPIEIVGNDPPSVFPLLTKIIDARKRLSVQVHPNDETAPSCGGEAKTECWYVLDAEPNAIVYAGLKPGTTAESFRLAMESSTLEDILTPLPVKNGDLIYIPGGRVHAIAEGCLLLEVQQNSNTTYRVYDWDRVDTNGKPRELHVDKALEVIDWNDNSSPMIEPRALQSDSPNDVWELIKSPYFQITRTQLKESILVEKDTNSFHLIFTVSGTTLIDSDLSVDTTPGTSCLLPAGIRNYRITPTQPGADIVCITR
jgi:mannose-6-phosphate isomerase